MPAGAAAPPRSLADRLLTVAQAPGLPFADGGVMPALPTLATKRQGPTRLSHHESEESPLFDPKAQERVVCGGEPPSELVGVNVVVPAHVADDFVQVLLQPQFFA